jgi:hypothetical protein
MNEFGLFSNQGCPPKKKMLTLLRQNEKDKFIGTLSNFKDKHVSAELSLDFKSCHVKILWFKNVIYSPRR